MKKINMHGGRSSRSNRNYTAQQSDDDNGRSIAKPLPSTSRMQETEDLDNLSHYAEVAGVAGLALLEERRRLLMRLVCIQSEISEIHKKLRLPAAAGRLRGGDVPDQLAVPGTSNDQVQWERRGEEPGILRDDNAGDSIAEMRAVDDLMEEEDTPSLEKSKNVIQLCHNYITSTAKRYEKLIRMLLWTVGFMALIVYLCTAIAISWKKDNDSTRPENRRFIYGQFVLVIALIFMMRLIWKCVFQRWKFGCTPALASTRLGRYLMFVVSLLTILSIVVLALVDTCWDKRCRDNRKLISLLGIVIFLIVCIVFSNNPGCIRWRTVSCGLTLQIIFAFMVLRWETGGKIMLWLSHRITDFTLFVNSGADFVFNGSLMGQAIFNNVTGDFELTYGNTRDMHVFALKVLPIIILYCACTNLLYYFGIIPGVVQRLAKFVSWTMGVSATEAINATANILLGQTEAPLLIRPYLQYMTQSQLFSVMTSGFATISGTLFGAFVALNIKTSHLIGASIMSAPGALVISKILYPETEMVSKMITTEIQLQPPTENNVFEALARGASQSISLIANILVNIIAFISLLSLANQLIEWMIGLVLNEQTDTIDVETILQYAFYPLVYVMGVHVDDCLTAGKLLGKKVFLNEFVAYIDLNSLLALPSDSSNRLKSPRTELIVTYALCGFANFGSIGVQVGAFSAMAPNRLSDFAALSLRAMIAGNIACFLTACIANIIVPNELYISSPETTTTVSTILSTVDTYN